MFHLPLFSISRFIPPLLTAATPGDEIATDARTMVGRWLDRCFDEVLDIAQHQ
jgi:hypothetical protein